MLWEGQSKDLTSLSTGGKIVRGRYRLTDRTLYWEEGVFSSNAQQVPLWAVRDLDVKQSIDVRKESI